MRYVLSIFTIIFTLQLSAQKKLELSNVHDDTFTEESVKSLNWMKDGQFYSALEDNKVIKYDVTTGAVDTVLFEGSKHTIEIDDYAFSSDEKKLLIVTKKKSIYRRSYTAEFFVYNIKSKQIVALSKNGPQSYATFSPDGTMVAFTRNNNLFLVKLVNMAESQITTDGEFNKIINGSTDWVYEEEFSITKAFFWSPDSKKIAYYRFDESKVKEYNMQRWNSPSLYPADYKFKYPKAGEANSTIEIKIHDIAKNEKLGIDIGTETDIYIPRIQWTQTTNLLSIMRLNRLQNKLDILHADAVTGRTNNILTERTKTYIDLNYCDELIYLDNGKNFLMSSERQGYKHFYLHTMDGQTVSQVTRGLWEATSIVGLDQSSSTATLYYIGATNSAQDRTLYKVSVTGKGNSPMSTLTGWTNADMSPDCKYYVHSYSQAEVPNSISLVQTKTNKPIKLLKGNESLTDKIAEYGLVKKQYLQIETDNKTLLDAYLLLPQAFDSAKQHPLLIFQYSGPGSQNVTNKWGGSNFIWHQYLVTQGYIVAVVDTRGTGFRGEDFKKMTYKQLGKYEVIDNIKAAQYLGSLPFINKERIGIWGWSYGGYMSSLAMLKGADVFKMGIAVAPVTTWRFYDTVYTERYLQRPEDNPIGYDDNSPLSHVEKLKGKFLLVHGTGDDNVHFQNSVALQDALIKAGKQFNSFYYPDKAHGIKGQETRNHLYQMMTEFIKNNL
jgi:dipeptidyl-peptidase-4